MQPEQNTSQADRMLSYLPQTPIFTGAWDHRPSVSSPLSSSPVRGSNPLSPIDRNTLPSRQVQSSPIQPPKFKFASRPTRPNPVVRRRDQVQEERRRNFLQSVRQKSDEKAWQRRDVEGQFVRNCWLADHQRFGGGLPDLTEADIEDAIQFSEGPSQSRTEIMSLDEMIPEEEDLEAMFETYEQTQGNAMGRPAPTALSDADYDELFAELLAQEGDSTSGQKPCADQMDTS